VPCCEVIDIEIQIVYRMVFTRIDKIIKIARIVQMIERITVGKTNNCFAFPYFLNHTHSANYRNGGGGMPTIK